MGHISSKVSFSTPIWFAISHVSRGSKAITRMPNVCILRVTSRPIRPIPSTASVFPDNSKPEYNFLSHRPSFNDWTAWGTLRAKLEINAHVNSQALMLFPPGVLKKMHNCLAFYCKPCSKFSVFVPQHDFNKFEQFQVCTIIVRVNEVIVTEE